MKTFVDFIYGLLIGFAVALFVGLGIWAFYSGPKFPEYPNYPPPVGLAGPTDAQNKEYQAKQQKFDQEMKTYNKLQKSYNKKIAIIALAAGIVFYLLGLWLMRKSDLIGEGLALGGAFTTIYAAARGATADFKPFTFACVSVLLAMFILLALYRKRIQRAAKA